MSRKKKGATELLNYIIDSYSTEEPIYSLAITDLNRTYIGSCGFSPIEKDMVCECYYSINKVYRGNGYAIEAIDALIAYLFHNTSYGEVRAYTHPENSYSSHVAQHVGMVNHGIQRHPVFNNEGLMYSVKKE